MMKDHANHDLTFQDESIIDDVINFVPSCPQSHSDAVPKGQFDTEINWRR